jgi:4-amino-4-deoxy-L-arabinose transferase-like glycosyltransferase
LPMMSFISASVTPDSMMFALWSLALWLGVRAIRRGITWPVALALSVTVGAACCVKGTSYGLLPAAALAVLAGLWRARPLRPVPALATVLAAVAGLAVTLGVWKLAANSAERPTSAQLSAVASTSGLNVRMLVSYLWQFYLPRLPSQSDFVFFGDVPPAWDIWIKGVWGRYGWLEVKFPPRVYLALAAVTAAAIGLAGVALWRVRRSVDWLVAAFLVLITVTLLAGLHWTEFQQVARGGGPLNQGRYLLPLVGVAGLVAAQALRALPVRLRPYGLASVVGGLLALQVTSLGMVLVRFYA